MVGVPYQHFRTLAVWRKSFAPKRSKDHLDRPSIQSSAHIPEPHECPEDVVLSVGAKNADSPERGPLNQSQCSLLLRLPAEVRVMIYHHVLCVPVPVIHIVRRKDATLFHVRCRAEEGECGTYRCYNDYSELSRCTKGGHTVEGSKATPTGHLLSLPMTCKKM